MAAQEAALYHFSEEPGIARFEPRYSELANDTLVWAIDAAHAHLYLFPRDCPRVTFYAGPETSEADKERFLSLGASRVVAIEAAWLSRLREARLYRHELPAEGFELYDECAGYWVRRNAVEPVRVDALDDLLGGLAALDVEVRIVPSLWPLYEDVVASTLQFSIIRWRNAAPRPQGTLRSNA
jgi:hypothetical protein